MASFVSVASVSDLGGVPSCEPPPKWEETPQLEQGMQPEGCQARGLIAVGQRLVPLGKARTPPPRLLPARTTFRQSTREKC